MKSVSPVRTTEVTHASESPLWMLLRLGESVFGRDDLSMAFVSREAVFVVYSPSRYTAGMGERWCTVTMIEESGRRHSVDV